MKSRRAHDPLDCAIREANFHANIVLSCLIGAAALIVAVLFLIWRAL